MMNNDEVSNSEGLEKIEAVFDEDKVTNEMVAKAQEIFTRILPNIEHIASPTDKNERDRSNIQIALNTFMTKYYDVSTGQPKVEALRELARVLISKVENISIEELVETARRVVEASTSDEIALYISKEKRSEADFSSSRSQNSNEFMIKLVTKLAKEKGKSVKVISTPDLENYDEITIIDDAIYSGEQLTSEMNHISRNRFKSLRVNIYCARATARGTERITDEVSHLADLVLSFHQGKDIKSLYQALDENQEVRDFFLTLGMVPHIESKRRFSRIWENAMDFVSSVTLTMTETKVPDFKSFLSILARSMPKPFTDDGSYPEV